jgi:hypothetical protein
MTEYEVNVALQIIEGGVSVDDGYTYQRHYFRTMVSSLPKAEELRADFKRAWPNAIVSVTAWEKTGTAVAEAHD